MRAASGLHDPFPQPRGPPSVVVMTYAEQLDHDLVAWLRDQDPALVWQVERDLLDLPENRWQATRRRVPHEGMGSRLLALQDDDGQWAGGAYFPAKHRADAYVHRDGEEPGGQPWTATTWSLKDLREWGVPAATLGDTADRLAASSRWEYDDLPYWDGEVDVCINGWTLATGAWLGVDVGGLEQWFVEHQLADGGWNCEWVEGSTRSSFHSTLNAVDCLRQHEEIRRTRGEAEADYPVELRQARRRGEEHLLERHLLYRLSDGEVVGEFATRMAYPYRWAYRVLRALDCFRAAAQLDGTTPDPRLADAVAMVRDARAADGTWIQEWRFPGAVWFEPDVAPGQPSPWLTLHALRVLRWWDEANPTAA